MIDLTQGRIIKQLLLFTFPLIIGNLCQQLYNFSDTLIVGQTLGVTSLAAVGATGSIMFLLIGFVQGLSSGLAILTAQAYGARDHAALRQSLASTIFAGLIATAGLTIIGLFGCHTLLKVMQTPPEIIDQSFTFISIIIGGLVATMAYNICANAMRAVGDSRAPLIYLAIAVVINITLELIFIELFHWGVAGAAIATVLAQLLSAVLSFRHIQHYHPQLALRWTDLKWHKESVVAHLRAGLPMGFQSSVIAIGAIVLQSALNSLGTDAVAAVASAQRIDQIVTLPMMSFGIAMATFAAQNYGAKNYSRIVTGVRVALALNIGIAVTLGVGEILFGHIAVQWFVGADQTTVLTLAQRYFIANASFYSLLATLFVIRYVLQGLNQVVAPTVAGIAELLMRMGAALILVTHFGFFGASLANSLAWLGSLIVIIPAYRRLMRTIRAKQA